ncbi:DNA-processing protein DprA [Ruegeria arenilitoris]|uniref:DNA-processing protein DprA n=1 Tax=Ruegeria arenilitoris TaxID=1173585 RepID=UPI00147CADEA|nr:DNA-processing protein DprA [Ruegeria arenilitoris]
MTEEQLSSHHPTLPPTTEEDRFSWLRLMRSRKVGPATFRRLLREHGSAQNALAALPEMARAAGIEGYEICPPGVIEAELKAAKAANAQLLCLGAADFPKSLVDLSDAPPVLWAIGNLSVLQRPMIALVGARNCSSLGSRMARALAAELAEHDYAVVSGLARGIDTSAHLATMATGTVAVMAGGVDVIYPAENAKLAEDLLETGLRLSEQPMGVTPQARHFPRRNRIISGLAQAVVVVEAAAKSGSLITARDALDQGREVLAVPGHPFDARAAGCNLLIRDGATLVRSAQDVIEALPQQSADPGNEPSVPTPCPNVTPNTAQKGKDGQRLHNEILSRLGPSPIAEDQLIRDIAATAGEIGPALVDLELDGRIQRQAGGLLSLAS